MKIDLTDMKSTSPASTSRTSELLAWLLRATKGMRARTPRRHRLLSVGFDTFFPSSMSLVQKFIHLTRRDDHERMTTEVRADRAHESITLRLA